ncbi:GntR family transcriptional regulator [Albimonas pacifica]|uniref:DNA-binding transcriptional regulator, GntR family n=1 Tax=Albimonas pacifica TaxID=1114924 RepID=A0A1I3JNS7_9RHOB|nr:GntR family transcriptional regulator [Albimonas pacifica]SFI61917.1 DNA-binding transcriptional regulator, GntR family [Albimonas pacifica]
MTTQPGRAETSALEALAAMGPLGPGASLGEAVFERLREALRAGRLRPGDRLREEEVAAALSVSRTPVREALGRMQARDLMRRGGGRGHVVRRLEAAEREQVYAMRAVLEGAAAGLAARHAGPADLALLEGLHARFAALPGAAAGEAAELNRAFHDALRRAAGNPWLDASLEALADAISLLGPTTFTAPGRHAEAIGEHGAILEAVRDGRAEAAEAAGRRHIEAAHAARLRLSQGEGEGEGRA